MTRRLSLTAVCLSLAPLAALPAAAIAQHRHYGKGPCPTCEAVPQPSCEAVPPPNCASPPPCKEPCNPPQQPQMPMMVQQPGVFMQPPANGTVQGPVEQRAIEGAAITFPELSLKFPSLRFPNMTRSRQNARMILDQQAAPYVEGPTVPAMPMQPAAPVAAAPIAAAPTQPMVAAAPQMMMMQAPQMMASPQMMMAPMPMQMTPQYVPQQYYYQQPQQPQAVPLQVPQPPPDNSPPRAPVQCPPAPSCDARGVPMAMLPAEEKIRQLELVERQLQQRMEQLRQQLEQVELTRRPPVPSPDLGARAIQLPATQPLRPAGIQPISQPIPQQPVSTQQLPVMHPVQPASRVYNERPAGFISEPQNLQLQYSQPQSNVIREPQAPTATITGFRSR